MAVSSNKNVSIHTEGFDKDSLLGGVSIGGSDDAATKTDVASIISEVRNGFNKFIQTQLTYAESVADESNDTESQDADDEINIVDDDSGENAQLDRIEENTNTIVTQFSDMGNTMAGVAAVGAAATTAMPAIEAMSEAMKGGVFGFALNMFKKVLIWIMKNPIIIFTAAVLLGTLYKILIKPWLDPLIAGVKWTIQFVKDIIQGIKDWWEMTVDGFKITLDALKVAWDATVEGLKAAWDAVKEFFSATADVLKGAWDSVVSGISETWEGIKTGLHNIIDPIMELVRNTWNAIREKIDSIMNFIKKFSMSNVKDKLMFWKKKDKKDEAVEKKSEKKTVEIPKAAMNNPAADIYMKPTLSYTNPYLFESFDSVVGGTKHPSAQDANKYGVQATNHNSSKPVTQNSPSQKPPSTQPIKRSLSFDTSIPREFVDSARMDKNVMLYKDKNDAMDFVKNTMPGLFEKKLKEITESGKKSGLEAEKAAKKEAMEEYLKAMKSMFDDFAKGRDKNDEELKKIFADGKVSKEEIASYMASSRNAEKITSTQLPRQTSVVFRNAYKRHQRSM